MTTTSEVSKAPAPPAATAGSGGRPATAAPLTAVLEQVRAGAPTLAVVAQRTGLPLDLVRMAVKRLVEIGELSAEPLDASCPADGCSGCPSAGGSAGASPTCALDARRGAPVVLRIPAPARLRPTPAR